MYYWIQKLIKQKLNIGSLKMDNKLIAIAIVIASIIITLGNRYEVISLNGEQATAGVRFDKLTGKQCLILATTCAQIILEK